MRHSPGVSRLQDTSPHPSASLSPHTSCFPAIFPLSARVSHFLAYTHINISNWIVFFIHFTSFFVHYSSIFVEWNVNIVRAASKGIEINYTVWWIYNRRKLKTFSEEEKRNECPFCRWRMIYCFRSIGSGASPTVSVAANGKALLSTCHWRIHVIGRFTF